MVDLDEVLALVRAMKREGVEYDGVPIRVVTPAQLYEMKRNTVRHKDRIDAVALRQKFSLGED